MLPHSTRKIGYDTIRLNWELGSDPTVFKMPPDFAWLADAKIPRPKPETGDILQLKMQLKCFDVEARGGGTLSLKSGETRLWRRQDGVFYELRRGAYRSLLSLECSLPKLLWGHNKQPVPVARLSDAFDELTRRGREFIPCLPDTYELETWRLDATSDRLLNSELELLLVSRVLADQPLNFGGGPATRYPSGGSLSWPAMGGFPGSRCYSKSVETGDEKLAGVYRSERQFMGGKHFRKALALAVANGDLSPAVTAGRGSRWLKGSQLIEQGERLCTGLLDPLTVVCDKAVDMVREVRTLTAWQAIDALEKSGLNKSRAVQLVGYSHLIRVFGWSATGLTRKGIWEAKKAFEVANVDPTLIEFSSAERFGAGAGMVVGGALAAGLAIAGAVAGSELADALFPNKPGSAPFVEPGPVPAGELEDAA